MGSQNLDVLTSVSRVLLSTEVHKNSQLKIFKLWNTLRVKIKLVISAMNTN